MSSCCVLSLHSDSTVTRVSGVNNWVDARQTCNLQGKRLAILNTETRETDGTGICRGEFVSGIMKCFVGLFRNEADEWIWLDGSELTSGFLPRWFENNPNESCGELVIDHGTSGWNDVACDEQRDGYALCEEVPPSQSPTEAPTLGPTRVPTRLPTTTKPTVSPSQVSTEVPSRTPSEMPSRSPAVSERPTLLSPQPSRKAVNSTSTQSPTASSTSRDDTGSTDNNLVWLSLISLVIVGGIVFYLYKRHKSQPAIEEYSEKEFEVF